MRGHRAHAGVQWGACEAPHTYTDSQSLLFSITEGSPAIRERALALGLPGGLRAAKAAHPGDSFVQYYAVWALGNLR